MKTICISLLLFVISNRSFSQSESDWSNTYRPQVWKGTDLASFVDEINFKPLFKLQNQNRNDIKSIFLMLDINSINQINITANYNCSVKHEELYQLWNLHYPKVNKSFWDKNCKGLIALMDIEGLILH